LSFENSKIKLHGPAWSLLVSTAAAMSWTTTDSVSFTTAKKQIIIIKMTKFSKLKLTEKSKHYKN
jgi:hypothetical protein